MASIIVFSSVMCENVSNQIFIIELLCDNLSFLIRFLSFDYQYKKPLYVTVEFHGICSQ